jgi:hypothetical protein
MVYLTFCLLDTIKYVFIKSKTLEPDILSRPRWCGFDKHDRPKAIGLNNQSSLRSRGFDKHVRSKPLGLGS